MAADILSRLRLLVALLALTGCGATAPEPVNLTGTWGGSTCAPGDAESCSIVLRITQDGTSLSGTYGYTTSVGTVSGTITGNRVSLTLTDHPGSFTCVAAIASQDRMSGTAGCGARTTNFEATRIQ